MRSPLSAAGALLSACLLAVPASAAPLSFSKDLSSQADGHSLLLQFSTGIMAAVAAVAVVTAARSRRASSAA
jgi:hypothetical protein